MLAALRLPARQLALRVALPRAAVSLRPASVHAHLFHSGRVLNEDAVERKGKGPRFMICLNCRREGHLTKDCKEPQICVACGVEGHQRKNCPSPDPARLEALKTAPVKCFRCGELGHGLKQCTEPPKCFNCGSTEHQRKDCPSYVPPPRATPAAADAPAA